MKPESYLVRALTGLLPVANKLLVAALLFASAAFQVQAQSYTVSALWSVGNGTANLVNDNNNRGLAYNVISNQVYIAGRTSTAKAISVLDGTSGAVIAADFPNISVLPYNIGVADDGVIYGVPLANGVNANNLNIYAWTNWNSLQRQCYAQVGGDATSLSSVQGQRVGDSFAIYGGGTNTLILLPIDTGTGSRTTNNMLLFSTADGQTFVPKVINISGFPLPFSDAGPEHGVAFVNSSNFLYRPGVGTSTYLISFPANFASLASPVAATVIATNTTLPNGAGSDVYLFSYSPAGKLLADYGQILGSFSSSSATSLALYDISGFPTANIMATTNTPHTVAANGNFTGGVALGGAGKTNAVYVLDSNNGVWAFALTYVGAPPPPTITSQPSGGTGVYVPFNLSVTAVGTGTLGYQWQVTNSAGSGFVNISGANTNIYAVTAAPVTNFYRVIVTNFAGAVTSSVVLVQTLKPVTNSAVASLWRVAAGQSGYSYLTPSSDGTRGIAYDTNSQRVVVASTSGLFVLDGNTGTNIETLSTVGVTFGGLLGGADQVGIADDGAVYICNVVNAGGQFNLYRWSAPSNSVTATSAYGADPAGGAANGERWGDTMAIRGAGPGTQILLGSRASAPSGTNVALLTPNDGVGLTYSSVIISVSGVPAGFAGYGISFGAGNTFWAKNGGGDLFEIAFDTNALTGTVIFDYKAPSQISGGIVGVVVDPVNSILAGI
ncbi:MAG TPA: hypothetical protein VG347_13165, partial [Verrucomicrobiae bacterium]|nr:hypothetical protein [Verrucomicrobiae bacterium]